jgi:hypothetical protein
MATTSKKQSQSSRKRGGTSAQHAKAGHLGGIAHHTCRGRECSKNKRSKSSHK